jgi:hypothetical protein
METRHSTYFLSATRVAIQLLLVIFVASAIQSCADDDDDDPPGPDPDEALFEEIMGSGYAYYQGGAILPADSASPHGSFRLRFNTIAQSALDSTGELPAGGTFPDGSILVKEVYDSTSLDLYAVMKKDPSNSNAGSGWLWAEYDTDESVINPINNNGTACVSCHSATPNRDLVRTFDFH